jgi:hypothetical protein
MFIDHCIARREVDKVVHLLVNVKDAHFELNLLPIHLPFKLFIRADA